MVDERGPNRILGLSETGVRGKRRECPSNFMLGRVCMPLDIAI